MRGPPGCGWRGPPSGRPRMSRGSGIDVLHQFVHEGGDEPDGADRLGIGHPGWAEDANDPDRPTGLTIRGEDERDVAHLLRRVLGADADLDGARPGHLVQELAEIR